MICLLIYCPPFMLSSQINDWFTDLLSPYHVVKPDKWLVYWSIISNHAIKPGKQSIGLLIYYPLSCHQAREMIDWFTDPLSPVMPSSQRNDRLVYRSIIPRHAIKPGKPSICLLIHYLPSCHQAREMIDWFTDPLSPVPSCQAREMILICQVILHNTFVCHYIN